MGNYYPLTIVGASFNRLLYIEDVVFPLARFVNCCNNVLLCDEDVGVEYTVGEEFFEGEHLNKCVVVSILTYFKDGLHLLKECVNCLPLVTTKGDENKAPFLESRVRVEGIDECIIGELAEKYNRIFILNRSIVPIDKLSQWVIVE